MVTWKFFPVFKGVFFMFFCFIVRKINLKNTFENRKKLPLFALAYETSVCYIS